MHGTLRQSVTWFQSMPYSAAAAVRRRRMHTVHRMRPIVTLYSVATCVCLLDTTAIRSTEMPSVCCMTQKGPRSRALGGARIPPQRKGQFWEISLGPLQNMPDYPACGRYSQPNRSRVDGISAEPPQNRLYTQQ